MLPVLFAMVPFGLLLGALAVQKGLSPLEVVLMSAWVFAGSAQFLAVELWSAESGFALIIGMTLVVNLRHVLMGAALAPVLKPKGPSTWFALHLMADEVWAMTLARSAQEERGADWAYYLGLAVPLYFNWLFWTGTGAIIGSVIDDPARYGFDFAFVAIFIVLVRGLARGHRDWVIWISAAAVSALVYHVFPGPFYVLAGALAGCVAALAIGPRTA